MIPKIKDVEDKMLKCLEAMQRHFMTVRTGKASGSILESVRVEHYGSMMAINELATIAIPEARLIEIRPWDKSALPSIEKAITKSDLGLTPVNDGKVIRLAIPSLTEDRRKELIKVAHKMAEEGRIAVRNVRHDANKSIDVVKGDKGISDDEAKTLKDLIQRATDRCVAQVETLLTHKEKEIMEV